jgi:hypothetical protein
MKFLSINTYQVDRLEEAAKATAKLNANPLEGYKILTMYSCQANPFPGTELPPGTMVTIAVLECDNAESMAAAALEMTRAGVNVNRIPVMEVAVGEVEETVERLKV